jgi:hypothetical protein
MAVLNNQACSFFEMGRYEEFWIAMRKLQCAMQTVARIGPDRHPEWGVFYGNLTMLDYLGPSAASAA